MRPLASFGIWSLVYKSGRPTRRLTCSSWTLYATLSSMHSLCAGSIPLQDHRLRSCIRCCGDLALASARRLAPFAGRACAIRVLRRSDSERRSWQHHLSRPRGWRLSVLWRNPLCDASHRRAAVRFTGTMRRARAACRRRCNKVEPYLHAAPDSQTTTQRHVRRLLLPVVVWIYGSGFQSGSPIPYNGSAMIRRSIDLGTPVIFMSMSYRIGALSQPGDLALQDQALALSWMRENMAAFGGDKTQTTLAGQSAGALSIWHHVVRANSSDEVWWRGVAAESCALDSYPLYPPRIRAAYFHYFAAVAGCPFQVDDAEMLACLRGIDEPSRLLQAHLAVMDAAHGNEVTIHPTPAVRLPEIGAYSRFPWKPSANAVPADWEVRLFDRLRGKSVLVSLTEDEGQLIVPKTAVHTDAEALSLLSHTFNSSARAERLWKLHNGTAQYRAARVLGDVWFHAPMRRLARELRAWYCLFDSRTEIVHHGGDLNALFYPEKGGVAFEMMDRWISFIAHGHPGDERWKTYPSALELNANPMPIPLWRVKEISAAEEVSLEIRAEVAMS